jgi:hypothetical protein
VKHVDGSKNKVADALSCYYEYDTWKDKCPPKDHVDVDIHLDPNHVIMGKNLQGEGLQGVPHSHNNTCQFSEYSRR